MLLKICALRNQNKSENETINQIKPENRCWKRAVRAAFNFNECNKLEQNSFNSIADMKINVIFEFNNINSSSADTTADTSLERKHQPGRLQILSKILINVASELLGGSRKA